jgi:hypothetical protein
MQNRAGRVAQVIEHLPNKCLKKKKEREREKREMHNSPIYKRVKKKVDGQDH